MLSGIRTSTTARFRSSRPAASGSIRRPTRLGFFSRHDQRDVDRVSIGYMAASFRIAKELKNHGPFPGRRSQL
jgi:hypothetical protein